MNALENLNSAQLEAATTLEGPLLILAGAGSGKTRTVISRIANIINSGEAWPSQILAITFTNKAAREMRERIESYNIEEANNIWMSTFHSACARILRMYGENLGYTRDFKILDSDDQKVIVKRLMKEFNLDPKQIAIGSVIHMISNCKNKGITPEEYKNTSKSTLEFKKADLFKKYNEQLKALDSMDFDDLILNTNRLFREHPQVLRNFQNKFKYIFVDEFQDTNKSQYEFVNMLAQGWHNLCVCGDDDQSIVRPYRTILFSA